MSEAREHGRDAGDSSGKPTGLSVDTGLLPGRRARAGGFLAALIVYALWLHVGLLGQMPFVSHEAHVARRTVGMVRQGRWLVPHLNGRVDLQKPPLPFWTVGGLGRLLYGDGAAVSEFTARLPQALSSVGLMVVLVLWTRRLASWRAGLITGLVYTTSLAALRLGRRAEADMMLAFLLTAAVYLCWLGVREPGRHRRFRVATGWALLGLTFLVKGPFALPFFLLAAGTLVLAGPRGRRTRAGRTLPLLGPLVMLAVALPWYLYVLGAWPEAFDTWWRHSVGRYAEAAGSSQGWWFYLLNAPLLWLPWVYALAMGLWAAFRRDALRREDRTLLLVWLVGGGLFLSLSGSKYMHYALAVTPPAMIFAGLGLERLVYGLPERLGRLGRITLGLHALIVPAVAGGAVALAVIFPARAAAICIVGFLAAAGITAALWLYARCRRPLALGVLAATFGVCVPAGVGAVAAPLMRSEFTLPLLGRMIAELPPEQDLCIYKAVNDTVLYHYAGRGLTIVPDPEAMRRWRAEHPGGLVIVKVQYLEEIRPLGPWRPVDWAPPVRFDRPRILLAVPREPSPATHPAAETSAASPPR